MRDAALKHLSEKSKAIPIAVIGSATAGKTQSSKTDLRTSKEVNLQGNVR